MPTSSFAGPNRREKIEKPSNFGVSYLRASGPTRRVGKEPNTSATNKKLSNAAARRAAALAELKKRRSAPAPMPTGPSAANLNALRKQRANANAAARRAAALAELKKRRSAPAPMPTGPSAANLNALRKQRANANAATRRAMNNAARAREEARSAKNAASRNVALAKAEAANAAARARSAEAKVAEALASGGNAAAARNAAGAAAREEAAARQRANNALEAEKTAHETTKRNVAAARAEANRVARNAANSKAREATAQRALNSVKSQLGSAHNQIEYRKIELNARMRTANLKHAQLERDRNAIQTKVAAARAAELAAQQNAANSKAGKNNANRAHAVTEQARQELERLLQQQQLNAAQALRNATTIIERKNAAAQAAAAQATKELARKERQLDQLAAAANQAMRKTAENAVKIAREQEREKQAEANATHQAAMAEATAAANKAVANKAVANAKAANAAARANAAEARAAAAEKKARESNNAATRAAANRARANANRAAANAKSAALAALTNHLTGIITGAIKNKVPGAPPAPKNKIPGNNMNLNVRATGGAGGTGGAVTFNPTITVGGGGANTAAILAQFMKAAPPSMNSELLQHIKNALKNKGGSNLTGSNKKELMDQLVMLMEEREQLMAKTNNASKTRLAVVEIKIKTTKQLLKALGITMANNNIKPVIPKNNLNQALSITNRFSRLQKLYDLFRQTKDTARKMRLAREIRLVVAKMYGSNVSTSNAIRNITNAGRLVGRGAVSKNVNRNLEIAMKILKNEAKSGGKRSGLRPSGSSSSYVPRGAYGSYGGMNLPRGGVNMGRTAGGGPGAPPVSITISNIGKVSNSGKTQVSNVGKVSNSGTTGRLAVSAPTTNGSRQLAATSEQLIRGAGGAEAVEQGIKALNAANGNVTRAKAASRLPNNTFTNIYAMGGPVAAKRLVESRRRRRVVGGRRVARVGLRVASKKKRVTHKPKKYIKLTPYQFKRLTDHIKKNNLRKVLIKEITH